MKKLTLMALAALCIAGCSKEETPIEYGSAKLSVEQGASVFVKSTTTQAPDTYIVSTSNTQNNTVVSALSGTYGTLKEKEITVPVGNYKVEAYNITETAAEEGRGAQRFYGSKELNVTAGTLSNVSFVCKMANARVSFAFDDSFKNMFDVENTTTPAKIVATSAANADRSIEYSNATSLAEDNSQIAYFNVSASNATLNFVITAVRKSDSQTKTYNRSITLQAQSWHQVTISASTGSGQAGIDITVDETITTVSNPITVDPYGTEAE